MIKLLIITLSLAAILLPPKYAYGPDNNIRLAPEANRLLLNKIREKEEKNWPACDIGDASEFGPWQIRLTTMRDQLGWKLPDWELVEILCDPWKNRIIADTLLKDCLKRRRWRAKVSMAYDAGICWNAGPRARGGPGNFGHEYATDLAGMYYPKPSKAKE